MNYDLTDIPSGYDRGRDLAPEMLHLWMDAIGSHTSGEPISQILDLGCGTGRFSPALATYFRAHVIGVDPSAKMLQRALAKAHGGSVHYLRARAEAIPLASRSVDMVFMSMSLHHFSDRRQAGRECRRVLRNRGGVFVRTGVREQIAAYPYVPFFPSTPSLMEEVLPDLASLQELFETAGFQLVASELITQTIARDWVAYTEKLSAGGDSVLARLSQAELEAGLAMVRSHAANAGDGAVIEPINFLVFR